MTSDPPPSFLKRRSIFRFSRAAIFLNSEPFPPLLLTTLSPPPLSRATSAVRGFGLPSTRFFPPPPVYSHSFSLRLAFFTEERTWCMERDDGYFFLVFPSPPKLLRARHLAVYPCRKEIPSPRTPSSSPFQDSRFLTGPQCHLCSLTPSFLR